jgi:hypothetical protein
VIGSASDIVGVWIEPVMAQLMMILFAMDKSLPLAISYLAFHPTATTIKEATLQRPKALSASQNPGGGQIPPAQRHGCTLISKFCRLALIFVVGVLSCARLRIRVQPLAG